MDESVVAISTRKGASWIHERIPQRCEPRPLSHACGRFPDRSCFGTDVGVTDILVGRPIRGLRVSKLEST